MCLLIACKKGTDKNSDFLFEAIRIASVRNSDGMGFAFKRNRQKKIFISKGYQSVEFFINLLKKKNLKVDDELIIHLRIGNKGGKTPQMCHPFVISNDNETILSNDEFIDNGVMAHNGTFWDFNEQGLFSDTFIFVKEFMSVPEIQSLLKRDLELFVKTFKFTLKANKLAFILPDSPLITIGDFTEDKGYLFSNVSYKRSDYSNTGGYEQWYGGNPMTRHFTDIEDDDDVIEHRPALPPARQGTFGFGSNHEKKLNENQIKVIEDLVAKGKATKVGTRKRDDTGNLLADSKFDLIPPINRDDLVPINNRSMRALLHPSPGLMIYVPLRYMTNQFDRSFFNPCLFNYDHFTYFSPLASDSEFAINPRTIYKIHQFDSKSNPLGPRYPIHGLNSENYDSKLYKGIVDIIWMTNEEMLGNFTQTIRSEYRSAYLAVYKLCKRFSNPSKNLYGQLVKAIEGAEKRAKRVDINFKNEPGLSLTGLKIYANYVIQTCYEWEVAKKMFYKVQDIDREKTIDFNTALAAFNNGELVN